MVQGGSRPAAPQPKAVHRLNVVRSTAPGHQFMAAEQLAAIRVLLSNGSHRDVMESTAVKGSVVR